MQSKQPAGLTNANTSVSSPPPIPTEYGPTVSAASAILSLAAFGVAYLSYRRSGKTQRAADFDRDYGSTLRDLLREFDKIVSKLSAFIYPSAKSVADLKTEIAPLQTELEEKAEEIKCILRELEQDDKIKSKDICKHFSARMTKCASDLAKTVDSNAANQTTFSTNINKSKEAYETAIALLRRNIKSLAPK